MNRRSPTPLSAKIMALPVRMVLLATLVPAGFWACDPGYPTSNWNDPDIDHLALSGGYQLTGVHLTFDCSACHDPGNYEPKYDPDNNQDCLACHQADYDGQHAPQGYPTTCTLCHTQTEWEDGSFDHETTSGGFDLWGPHAEASCTACHVAGSFEPKYDPEDDGDCTACHHLPDSGGFDLWGPHLSLPCTACHDAQSFEPLFDPEDSADCEACH